MLTILILAFYFTEIKQKKNMSKGTFIFIYVYISCLFSFISYVTLYNISCILMENMEVQDQDVQTISYTIIKVSINAGQTILSFVLLTYFKDVFFAYTSGYIICAVFIHENFNLEKENSRVGLHEIVNHKKIVSKATLKSCCAINAQTPNPWYAKIIPTIAAPMVPNNVAKKNFLNWRCLETYACSIFLTLENKMVIPRTRKYTVILLSE